MFDGGLIWRRKSLVRILATKKDSVDHNGLSQARKRVFPQTLKNLVVSPCVLMLKYHVESERRLQRTSSNNRHDM